MPPAVKSASRGLRECSRIRLPLALLQQISLHPISEDMPLTPYADTEFPEQDSRLNYFVRGKDVQNFGDYLTEIMAYEMLTSARMEADMFLLVGSVISANHVRHLLLDTAGQRSGSVVFWGCGVRNSTPLPAQLTRNWHFCSVRGPLTRDVLQLPADTVLGDPGLLAPLFHTPQPNPATLGKSICIPHVHDPKPHSELLAMSGCDAIISPECPSTQAGVREVLDKIASADFVLTGSLHGAIIACAYGRPFAFWNTGHVDAPFKWRDFAQSVSISEQFATDLADGRRLYDGQIAPSYRPVSMTALLDACPFAVRPSVMVRAMVHDGLLAAEDEARLVAAFSELQSEQQRSKEEWNRISQAWRRDQASIRSTISRYAMQSLARFRGQFAPK